MAAGVPASRIVFSGVAKTEDEMRIGLERGIHQFNVETCRGFTASRRWQPRWSRPAPIAFRVNPHVEARRACRISAGTPRTKFGIASTRRRRSTTSRRSCRGSSRWASASASAARSCASLLYGKRGTRSLTLVRALRTRGIPISRVDFGGGSACPTRRATIPIRPRPTPRRRGMRLGDLDVQLILEPGRLIAGNAGV